MEAVGNVRVGLDGGHVGEFVSIFEQKSAEEAILSQGVLHESGSCVDLLLVLWKNRAQSVEAKDTAKNVFVEVNSVCLFWIEKVKGELADSKSMN